MRDADAQAALARWRRARQSSEFCSNKLSRVKTSKIKDPTEVCVFITAVPITKLFARGGGGMEDMWDP